MQTQEISNTIIQSIGQLNHYQQTKLLEFINSLVLADSTDKQGILKFAGAIDKEDLLKIEQAINADCEKIDSNEW